MLKKIWNHWALWLVLSGCNFFWLIGAIEEGTWGLAAIYTVGFLGSLIAFATSKKS